MLLPLLALLLPLLLRIVVGCQIRLRKSSLARRRELFEQEFPARRDLQVADCQLDRRGGLAPRPASRV